ncbi:MAG: tRNA uridine-5-carboxymethylaminomethyl(34) synthesis GTPase MnmE [Acidobacteriota bacterium]
MFSTGDTIVAIATPPGRGGLGVVRLSGPSALTTVRHLLVGAPLLQPRHATFARVHVESEAAGAVTPAALAGMPRAIDQVVATYFQAPRSYTGEDVVELSAHGSPVVLRAIVASAIHHGARLAEPGEFTLRGFLNGRIDLPQAEAVADLIDAVTPLQARAAFDQLQGTLTTAIAAMDQALFDVVARLEASVDFPDEGFHFIDQAAIGAAIDQVRDEAAALLAGAGRGRLVREGLHVVIAGKPNVGKSSVFNMLAGADRAIVASVPGTTRDLVTEQIDMEGVPVTLVDTAGLHGATDIVEIEGMARSRQAQGVADVVLVVLDGSRPLDADDDEVLRQTIEYKRVVVVNKIDISGGWRDNPAVPAPLLVSAATGAGMGALRRRLTTILEDGQDGPDEPAITNVRHIALVRRAQEALTRARAAVDAAGGPLSEEFLLADLQEARAALEEVVGRRTSDDLLAYIFSRFCIGK